MGQAKTRGNRADRVTEARRQADAARPPQLMCNRCQANLAGVQAMDARSLPGIRAAFAAHCEACETDTWAVKGDAAAVRAFYDALEKSAGSPVKLGTAVSRPAEA